MVKPSARKAVARELIHSHNLSERSACRLVKVSRSGYRYQPRLNTDEKVRRRLKELAAQYPRYGYLMLHSLLKSEGLVVNKKRTYRLYTEEALQVRTKKRKKLQRPLLPMEVPMNTVAAMARSRSLILKRSPLFLIKSSLPRRRLVLNIIQIITDILKKALP